MSSASEAGAAPRNRWLFGIARAGFGLALAAFVLSRTDAWADPRILRGAAWLLAPAALLTLLGAGIEAVRLSMLLRPQGISVAVGDAFRLVAVSTLWGFVVPGGVGGDVAKAVYLGRRDRSRLVELGMTLIVDRFVGLMSMLAAILILAVASADFVAASALLKTLVAWAAAGFVGLASAFAIAQSRTVRKTPLLVWATTRAPLSGLSRRVLDALGAYRDHAGTAAAAFAVSLAGNAGLAVTFLLAASHFMPDLTGARPALLAMLGMLANAIPATPGGLGVGEAAFEALFRSAGHADGSLVSLTWRFGMVVVAAVGAAIQTWGVQPAPAAEAANVSD